MLNSGSQFILNFDALDFKIGQPLHTHYFQIVPKTFGSQEPSMQIKVKLYKSEHDTKSRRYSSLFCGQSFEKKNYQMNYDNY